MTTLKRVFRDKIQSLSGFQVGTRQIPIDIIAANGTLQHPQLAELVGGEQTSLHSHAHSEDNAVASATPVSTAKATATLTFTDAVSDGETVTIGEDVYEFDTAATSTITEGNIRVNVNAAQTATAAVTALVAAITGNTGSVVVAVDGAGDTVVLTAKEYGADGNSIAVDTDCANGSFGESVEALSGGADGTVGAVGQLAFDSDYIYICTSATNSVYVWKKAALS